jgi:hypothetical protein
LPEELDIMDSIDIVLYELLFYGAVIALDAAIDPGATRI